MDSLMPYNTVILRVMVSGWDSIAFGIFHASEGCVCVFGGGVEAKVLVLDNNCALCFTRNCTFCDSLRCIYTRNTLMPEELPHLQGAFNRTLCVGLHVNIVLFSKLDFCSLTSI